MLPQFVRGICNMPTTEENRAQIERLLAVARETIGIVRHCWVATRAEEAGAHARAVQSFAGAAGSDEWTRRFLSRRGARKVAEIRRDPGVTLAYRDYVGDVYVALVGRASPSEDKVEMRSLWQSSVRAPFPEGFAEMNMIVVNVEVDRIEIHARGVTAEPFGYGRTLIERAAEGWRFAPD
jgi:general stress protein 26